MRVHFARGRSNSEIEYWRELTRRGVKEEKADMLGFWSSINERWYFPDVIKEAFNNC